MIGVGGGEARRRLFIAAAARREATRVTRIRRGPLRAAGPRRSAVDAAAVARPSSAPDGPRVHVPGPPRRVRVGLLRVTPWR